MSSARASSSFIAPSAQRARALRPRLPPVCVSRPHARSVAAFVPPFLPSVPPRSALVATLSTSPSTSSSAPASTAAAPRSLVHRDAPALLPGHSSARPGRKHTPESRRKIAIANRGNVPWNKGRPHSDETRRKIAENTRKAMMRPEMRRLLQQKATGRKHTEETKLKIRQAARTSRPPSQPRPRRRRPLRFLFPQHVVKQLNLDITQQIEHSFEREHTEQSRYVVRPKRSLSEQTKAKLSDKIKKLWADPQYRQRVSNGIQHRQRQNAQTSASSTPHQQAPDQPSTKRRPRNPPSPAPSHTTDPDELEDDDIVLRSEDLAGITMEDLAIPDTHHAGIVAQPESQQFAATSSTLLDHLYTIPLEHSDSSPHPSAELHAPLFSSPSPQPHSLHQLTTETLQPSPQQPQPHPSNVDSAQLSLCSLPISPAVDTHVFDHAVPLPTEPDAHPLASMPLVEPQSAFSIPHEQYDHQDAHFIDATSNALINTELLSSSWLKSSSEDVQLPHSVVQSLDFLDADPRLS